jgi:hypothetical protein
MSFIKDKEAYPLKSPVSLSDFIIGTNSEMANGQTRNFAMQDVLELFTAGLSPEEGGTLKVFEIEYAVPISGNKLLSSIT